MADLETTGEAVERVRRHFEENVGSDGSGSRPLRGVESFMASRTAH